MHGHSWSPRGWIVLTLVILWLSSSATSLLTFLVSIDMSWQLFYGLPWDFVETFITPRGWTLPTLMSPWLFIKCQQADVFPYPVKKLIMYLMDWHQILYIHSFKSLWYWWTPDVSSNVTIRFCVSCLYSIGWITPTFGTDIHVLLKMN